MNCTNCGAPLLTEYKFCPECGHSKINPATKPVTKQTKYESCILQVIIERDPPKGILEKLAQQGQSWIVIVAKSPTSGKEIIRAKQAANSYFWFHGNQKDHDDIERIIENGKNEIWSFLESTGWEFQSSERAQFMPCYFFRKRITSS